MKISSSQLQDQINTCGAIPIVPTLAIGSLLGVTATGMYAVNRATQSGNFPYVADAARKFSTNMLIIAAIAAGVWYLTKKGVCK